MAVYSAGTGSKVWGSRGFLSVEVDRPSIIEDINRHNRDCRIVFNGDDVTRIMYSENMVKPGPDTFADDDDIDEVS